MAGTSRTAESQSHLFDVFINHRGGDVKKTFVAHLDAALRAKKLRPFLDKKDIKHGRDVFKSIDEALHSSCVHVAIFSEGYAGSKHCLDELCKILAMESRTAILPVFYHVDPSDLRRVDREPFGPFKENFRKLIERETELTERQIFEWKQALYRMSDTRGFRLDEVNGDEEALVRGILVEVRRLMSDETPGEHNGGVDPGSEGESSSVGERNGREDSRSEGEISSVGEPIGVDPGSEGEISGVGEPNGGVGRGSEEEISEDVTFIPGDRRLNILVLGDPELVEAVIGRICGAGMRQTRVERHVNLRECKNASPPMCLYSRTQGVNRNNFNDIRTFVEVRNKKWRRGQVKALWAKQLEKRGGGRNQPPLFPDRKLRLHAIWFACRNLLDLPNHLEWPEIAQKLCDLPLQILVVEQPSQIQDLDSNFQQKFNMILNYGSDFFPNAHNAFMEELIVQVALNNGDLKGELWCKCWAVKTRLEIGNAARIIREIRKQLGSAGKCVQRGVGGARIRKEVMLSVTRDFVCTFLCSYWDIPPDSLHRVFPWRPGPLLSQARGSERGTGPGARPCSFVECCLIVAAIILKYNAGRPEIACSGSSLVQLLQAGAEECYNSYFAPSSESQAIDYDSLVFEDIRLFLEEIFAGQDPRPAAAEAVVRNSSISKIVKVFYPRWKSVPVA